MNEHSNQKIIISGEVITELPDSLYIPPDALEIILETFEGPLDLLLYLIRKQNINILDIPVFEITQQYMKYIDLIQNLEISLAAEYLLMSAILAEIKSQMLLPKNDINGEEEDPRAELARRLQEYEIFKLAAEQLDEIPRRDRDTFSAYVSSNNITPKKQLPAIKLSELVVALQSVFTKVNLSSHHHVTHEQLSVRERMAIILCKLEQDKFTPFLSFFSTNEGKLGVVVTFLAILELVRSSTIELFQQEPFSPIYLRAA